MNTSRNKEIVKKKNNFLSSKQKKLFSSFVFQPNFQVLNRLVITLYSKHTRNTINNHANGLVNNI